MALSRRPLPASKTRGRSFYPLVTRYPLDIDNNPRVSGGNQSTSLHGPNLNPTLQVSTTNNTDVIVKKGVRQWVNLLNRDAAPQNYHQNSNEGNGESSGLAKGQRVFGVEASDVVLAEDSFDTCGNFKNKEVEGPVSEEAASAAPHNGDTQPQHTDFDTARGNTQ
ncbi:hypothetical protein glysoja_045597 [Glycine soja]|uniref:Uncharacterized protein n=1 Tax=Glycine soja TaxID=3848 RepID=A0A0B2P642_GLYSO|nr:hypothetical protein glysoja_045597 [Glycine soja]